MLSQSVLSDEVRKLRERELLVKAVGYAVVLLNDKAKNIDTAAVNLPTYIRRIPRKDIPIDRRYFLELVTSGRALNSETVRFNALVAAKEVLEPSDRAWLKASLSSKRDLQVGAGKFLEELPA